MTTISLDARPHAAAVIAALDAAEGPTKAYEYDNVPGSKYAATEALRKAAQPEIYWIVSVERRTNPQVRATSTTTRTGWRLSIRSVGRTVAETRWAMARAARVLNQERLSVAVVDAVATASTRVQFETDQAPEPDEGRYSALSSWTYAL